MNIISTTADWLDLDVGESGKLPGRVDSVSNNGLLVTNLTTWEQFALDCSRGNLLSAMHGQQRDFEVYRTEDGIELRVNDAGLNINSLGEASFEIGGVWVLVWNTSNLTDAEWVIHDKMHQHQTLCDGRTRMAYFAGKAVMETEFEDRADHAQFWSMLERCVRHLDAELEEMDTHHLESTEFRHVCIQEQFPLEISETTLKVRLQRHKDVTQDAWNSAGYGVL